MTINVRGEEIMGLRFHKSINLGKGVRLNLNSKSVGVSAGVKGARVSVNSSGRKTATFSVPGTGLSYTTNLGKKKSSKSKKKTAQSGGTNKVLVGIIVVLVLVIAAGVYAYQNGMI